MGNENLNLKSIEKEVFSFPKQKSEILCTVVTSFVSECLQKNEKNQVFFSIDRQKNIVISKKYYYIINKIKIKRILVIDFVFQV